jgi:hypothetical protein
VPPSTTSPAPVARPKRPSWLLLLFAPVPGIGHWLVRRGGRGLLALMVFTAGANLLMMSVVMKPVTRLSPVWGWVFAGAGVLYSLVDVTRIIVRARSHS